MGKTFMTRQEGRRKPKLSRERMDTCRFSTGRRALVTLSPSWKLPVPSGHRCPGTRPTVPQRKPPSPLQRLRHPRPGGAPPGRSLHPAPTALGVVEGEFGAGRRDPDSLGKQATDGPVSADLTLALGEPWLLYSGAMGFQPAEGPPAGGSGIGITGLANEPCPRGCRGP